MNILMAVAQWGVQIKNTSLSYRGDEVALYNTRSISFPMFQPCFTPSTTRFNPTEIQISYTEQHMSAVQTSA